MRYIIEINMDTEAFKQPDGSETELTDILRGLARLCLHVEPYEGTLHDTNLEICGTARIEGRR